MKISTVFLYDEPTVPEININGLSDFLQETFHFSVEIRKSIFNHFHNTSSREIAECRIFNTRIPFEPHTPTEEEINFEESYSKNKEENIVMYDGFEFLQCLDNLIPSGELDNDQFHLIFTNKLMCTFDYNDYRYHGRAVICSNPSIISTTGIIEAPAKPREFYFNLLINMNKGLNLESIKNQFKGTFLEYHDPKLTKVIEGYAMQSLFYYLIGEAFCEFRDCKLFNSHWQSDLFYSQLTSGKLCERHGKALSKIVSK